MKTTPHIAATYEIVFDNGGGATLQTHDGTTAIHYENMGQLAHDAALILNGDDSAPTWDGNDLEMFISDETYEQHARNGGYFALQLDPDYLGNWPEAETAHWNNVQTFLRAITCPCGKIACRIGHDH